MPCHHALAEALHAYIYQHGRHRRGPQGMAIPTSSGHNGDALSDQAMDQSAAWRMIPPASGSGGHHLADPAITRSGRPGSPRTFRMAVPSNTLRKWPRTARRSGSHRTRWRGFGFSDGCSTTYCCWIFCALALPASLVNGLRPRLCLLGAAPPRFLLVAPQPPPA